MERGTCIRSVPILPQTRYYSFLVPANSKGTAYTGEMATTKGSITYYYPSDYVNVLGGWSYVK